MQVKKDIMWRINGSFIFICLMGFMILIQILRIQIVEGPPLIMLADSQTIRYIPIPPSRGNIFSSDGRLLSTSVPVYEVRIDTRTEGFTREASKIDSLGLCFSQLFRDRSEAVYTQLIRTAIAKKERFFLLQKDVTYSQLQKLKSFPIFRLGKYKGGLCIEQKEYRQMPFQDLASRTIGCFRDSNKVGIEGSFNNDLNGTGGNRLMQKISGNVWMPITDKDEIEPKDGNDVITTIDINIQGVAENSLRNQLKEQNADHGCAVLMEVKTGEIKAVANLTRNKNGEYDEVYNYVISESTEPGSTMKTASILAALDDGLVEPNDTVEVGNGKYMYYGVPMEDAHSPKASRLSVLQAFETSSNVGISKTIRKAYVKNPQAFIDKLKSFGLSKRIGLQIEGEGRPFIKDTHDETWSGLSLPWISIGYESSLTPLQMLAFYNAIANNGVMVKPRFVKEIRDHGKLVRDFPVEVLRDSIASKKALATMRMMLEGVVQNGTASSLKSSPYKIAGKTGTAQISKNKLGYDKNNRTYQASFVGYFPADAPKYSCIVVVNSPSNDLYFGGAVAAPVFKEIADKVYANHLDMNGTERIDSISNSLPVVKAGYQKDLKRILTDLAVPIYSSDEEAEFVSQSSGSQKITLGERKVSTVFVADVRGMGARDAISILENSGLKVVLKGKGLVMKQSLTPGSRIYKNQQIEVELGL